MTAPEDWLARCRRGDTAAWRDFHARHYDFVVRVARRLGCFPADVEDVAQEAFVIAFQKLDRFRDGQVTTWLYRIVSNLVASRVRRAQVRRAVASLWGGLTRGEPTESAAPDAGLESADANVVMERVLSKMAPRKREVFMLYELEELPGDTIAEMVGCSVATVWSRLFYARKEFEQLARAELGDGHE